MNRIMIFGQICALFMASGCGDSKEQPDEMGGSMSGVAMRGLQSLGNQSGWRLFFDESSNNLVVQNDTLSVTITQKDLENPAALEQSGLPTRSETIRAAVNYGGAACRAACWGAAAYGCYAVAAACSGATFLTVGSTAIPCAWAIVAACAGAGGAGASICGDYCTAYFGG